MWLFLWRLIICNSQFGLFLSLNNVFFSVWIACFFCYLLLHFNFHFFCAHWSWKKPPDTGNCVWHHNINGPKVSVWNAIVHAMNFQFMINRKKDNEMCTHFTHFDECKEKEVNRSGTHSNSNNYFFHYKNTHKKTTIVRLIQTQYFCMFCLDAVAKVNCLPPCICSFFCGRKWGFIVFWFLLFSYACAYWRFWTKKKWCRMQTVWFVK